MQSSRRCPRMCFCSVGITRSSEPLSPWLLKTSSVTLIVPEDEYELAATAGADETLTFQPASLDRLGSAAGALKQPLRKVLRRLGIERLRSGSSRARNTSLLPMLRSTYTANRFGRSARAPRNYRGQSSSSE